MANENPQRHPSGSGGPTIRLVEELGQAVTFLTRMPWPGPVSHDRPLMDAAWAFPVVGALVVANSSKVNGLTRLVLTVFGLGIAFQFAFVLAPNF